MKGGQFFYMKMAIGVIAVLAITGFILMAVIQPPEADYGIMIDAGSSGTRLHIYTWPRRFTPSLPLVHDAKVAQVTWSVSTKPGISSYSANPEKAGESLKKLLDYAVEKIPGPQQHETPLYLKATAGMRLLPEEQQAAILKAIRTFISTNYEFLFNTKTSGQGASAQVISGADEGLFGWITVNYLLGKFNKTLAPSHPTLDVDQSSVGALDLGGASTQITFEPPKTSQTPATKNGEGYQSITLGGKTFTVWVHSYLGFGLDQGRDRVTGLLPAGDISTDPCLPTGFNHTKDGHTSVGAGNFEDCKALAVIALNATKPCQTVASTERCSYDGVPMPLIGSRLFAGFSGFFYTAGFYKDVHPSPKPLTSSTRSASATSAATIPMPKYHGDMGALLHHLGDRDAAENALRAADGDDDGYIDLTPDMIRSRATYFCGLTYEELRELYSDSKNWDYITNYCFFAAWSTSMLGTGYGFVPDGHNVTYLNSLANVEVGWALGAMIYEENLLPLDSNASYDTMHLAFLSVSIVLTAAALFLALYIFYRLRVSPTRYQAAPLDGGSGETVQYQQVA